MNERNYTSLSYIRDCVLWNKIQKWKCDQHSLFWAVTECLRRLICGIRAWVCRWKHWKNLSFMSSSVTASQDVLFRGRSVQVNHPKGSFCSLNSSSVKNLPVTKHQLVMSNAKWTCRQFKDFEEAVKLTVGNFRRSWVISTIYECSSGWSICCCCFVIVLSHVASGSMFTEILLRTSFPVQPLQIIHHILLARWDWVVLWRAAT